MSYILMDVPFRMYLSGDYRKWEGCLVWSPLLGNAKKYEMKGDLEHLMKYYLKNEYRYSVKEVD